MEFELNRAITDTNRELGRLQLAQDEDEAESASRALLERHLPALDAVDRVIAVEARATHRWMLEERRKAAQAAAQARGAVTA